MKTMSTPKLYPANTLSATEKKSLGLQALQSQVTVSSLSKQNNVSRKFINAQKNKIVSAVDNAFDTPINNEPVLFNLPVTHSWLKQFVLSLVLDGKASFRGVQKAMHSLLDHHYSIGHIFNILHSLIPKATAITTGQNLSAVKLGANDELFQHNKPVLAGVDLKSLYCYLLAEEKQRDGETWAIHLLDLEKQHFNPERVIADLGQGLRAGLRTVYPHTPCDSDHFHILRDLFSLRRSFRNHLKSAISYHAALTKKIKKTQQLGRHHKKTDTLEAVKTREDTMRYLSNAIDTLVSWIDHDILNKAGPPPAIRRELFNFVLTEFRKLEAQYPQQIGAICTTLDNQRERLLGFADALNDKFEIIARQFSLPLETVWQCCELQRCKHGGDRYRYTLCPSASAIRRCTVLRCGGCCDCCDEPYRTHQFYG